LSRKKSEIKTGNRIKRGQGPDKRPKRPQEPKNQKPQTSRGTKEHAQKRGRGWGEKEEKKEMVSALPKTNKQQPHSRRGLRRRGGVEHKTPGEGIRRREKTTTKGGGGS